MGSLARSYVNELTIGAAVARIRTALLRPESWLPQWRHVRNLEIVHPGRDDDLGRIYRTTVRAVAPYQLTWEMEVVRAEKSVLAWVARGDLAGTGRVELTGRGEVTDLVASWNVAPTAGWMVMAWPFARRLFVRNHDLVVVRGARRLADHLEAPLLRCEPAG